MKTLLRIVGILLWVVGIIWMVYIVGAVFSRTEGYLSLAGLVGPFVFHTVCMVLGGVCFTGSTAKAPAAEKASPVAQAR